MTEGKKKLAVILCLTMLLGMCTPIVSPATVQPAVGANVSTNNSVQVVSTQAKLKTALAKSSVRQIVIKTDKAVDFAIPEGNYSNKNLVVRAPEAEIENSGTFKSVTIYAISDRSFVENASHNKIRVMASSGRIVVQAGRTLDSLTIVKKNSKVRIDVNGYIQQMDVKKAATLTVNAIGSIKKMNVNAASTITMTGSSKDTTVIVNKAAKNSRITTSIPVTVKLKAATTVTLKSGAENAKLVVPKSNGKAISYTLVNDTNSTLKLNTSSGIKTLAVGKSYDGKASGSSGTTIMGGGSSGGSGGGSSGGSGGGSSGGSGGGSSGGSGGGSSGGSGDSSGSSGGGSSGSSGDSSGSSGGSGGDSSSGADSSGGETETKGKLAVSLQALSINSFRVYIDTEYALGDLDVKVTPDNVGKITQTNEMGQWHCDYSYGNRDAQRYTYYCDFTTEKPLGKRQEYKVSIAKEGYQFDERTFNADMEYGLHELDGSISVLEYKAPHYIEVDSTDNSDMEEAARDYIESSLVGGTALKNIILEDKTVNQACAATLILERSGVEKEVPCELYFIDMDTEEGQWLQVKKDLQNNPWEFYEKDTDDSGRTCYTFDEILNYDINATWESENEDIIQIEGNKGWLKQLGLNEEVTVPLRVHLSNEDGTKTETIKVQWEVDGDTLAYLRVDAKSSGENGDKWTVTYRQDDFGYQKIGDISFQWYIMEGPGYWDKAKAIEGATSSVYTIQDPGKKGTFWYFCAVSNTVGNVKSVSYSDPVIRKSFTGNKEDTLIMEDKLYPNPKGDKAPIQPGVDFPKVTAQSGLVVFYSCREAGSDRWWDGFFSAGSAGTYEIKAYTVGNSTYKEASKIFTVTIEP